MDFNSANHQFLKLNTKKGNKHFQFLKFKSNLIKLNKRVLSSSYQIQINYTKELLEKKGRYYNLYQTQFAGNQI